MKFIVMVWVLVVSACVAPSVTSCPDVDCPFNEVCDGHGGCARQAAIDVCVGKPEGASCSYAETPDGQCSNDLCLPVGCGNYFVTPGEVCDDGNTTNGDGCSADCASNEMCGNGIVDPAKGEQCDDGNLVDGDGCQHDCRNPRCGDGIADAVLNEQCDSGSANSSAPDAPCRPNCQRTRCGDGVRDTGEVCDDNNVTSGDGCAGDCKSNETCGNSTIDVIKGEVCDDGNVAGGDGCSANCKSTEACGNGVLDTARGEVCDDGNIVSGDGCSSDCKSLEICGNGIIDTIDEQCDLGLMMNSDLPDSMCRTNCKRPTCGDMIVDPVAGEACDAGAMNANLPNKCRLNCQVPRCGDTIRDAGEVCDDGNSTSGDNCSADCRSLEVCGNGILDAAKGEQCDDMNLNNGDACRNDCTLPVCGDGRLDTFEACDRGMLNSNAPDALCRLNCQLPRCGDSVRDVLAGEVCDDGNIVSGDNCSADCRSLEICGNSLVDTAKGEQCDAGGLNSNAPNAPCRTSCQLPKCGDSITDNILGEGCDLGASNSNAANATCRANCQPRRCGDAILDTATEVCDDGNTIAGDNCSADCASNETCGNGIVDFAKGEQCDDMNVVNLDQCHNNCSLPRCGDGVVDFNEQCDAGAANSNAPNSPCRTNCQPPRCGDNILDTARGEVCDDGNLVPGDGCRPDCLSNETCGNAVVDVIVGESCDDGNLRGRDGCSKCKAEDAIVLTPGQTPPARGYNSMAYDGARQRVVMFGGYGGNPLGDTWEWDGVSWTQIKPVHSPPVRYGAAMAYDAKRLRVVLFGGYNNTGARGDTWEWDGVDWVDKQPISSPSARGYTAMAYDAVRGSLILYGGGGQGDTWEWNGSTWASLSPSGNPGGRNGHVMVYDTIRNQIVLYGGGDNHTWVWTGASTTWVDKGVVTAGMPNQFRMGMAFDVSRQRVVLANGAANVTWEWDGNAWASIAGTAPPVREVAAAAYDPIRKQVVLFGGCCWRSDTWLRSGTTWTSPAAFVQPSARLMAPAVFDPLRNRVVLFGGNDGCSGCTLSQETWEWDGSQWRSIAATTPPSPRSGGWMDYNTQTRTVTMFGGADDTYTLDQSVWSFNGSGWSQAPSSTGRPAVRTSAMAYDRNADRVVTFGGRDDASSYSNLDTTWTWSTAGWVQTAPAALPSARRNAAMAYDPVRKRTVMFGGQDDLGPAGDVWEWTGATWIRLNATGPSGRTATSLVFNPDLQKVVVFGHSPDAAEDLWEWSGAEWTQRFVDTTIAAKYRPSVAYDAVHHNLVTFGGRDPAIGPTGATQLIRYRPNVSVEACNSNVDYDRDGMAGCADSDCWSVCTPLCPPGTSCPMTAPKCGDGVCNPNLENCSLCPSDCGMCPAGQCGDYTCNQGESPASCPTDC